ncbi:MAG: DUF4381 domain-containing protein [Pirellulales bacterium]|nr:DUF4381 domain-containing protein [Pirellulales bacterium]
MTPDPASLDRLHDIVSPPPAPWWPPAPGWWIVAAVAIYLAILGAVRWLHAWQQNRYRRDALRELHAIRRSAVDPPGQTVAVRQLAELLKRTALSAWPRQRVASLTGLPWRQFLDSTAGSQAFEQADLGAAIERGAYDMRAAASIDARRWDEMLAASEHWIRRHRREASP